MGRDEAMENKPLSDVLICKSTVGEFASIIRVRFPVGMATLRGAAQARKIKKLFTDKGTDKSVKRIRTLLAVEGEATDSE